MRIISRTIQPDRFQPPGGPVDMSPRALQLSRGLGCLLVVKTVTGVRRCKKQRPPEADRQALAS